MNMKWLFILSLIVLGSCSKSTYPDEVYDNPYENNPYYIMDPYGFMLGINYFDYPIYFDYYHRYYCPSYNSYVRPRYIRKAVERPQPIYRPANKPVYRNYNRPATHYNAPTRNYTPQHYSSPQRSFPSSRPRR